MIKKIVLLLPNGKGVHTYIIKHDFIDTLCTQIEITTSIK